MSNSIDLWAILLTVVPIVFALYIVAVAIMLINDQRDSTKTLSWLLLLWILPVIGLVLYFFLGRNFRKRAQRTGWWETVAKAEEKVATRLTDAYASEIEAGEKIAAELGFGEVTRLAHSGELALTLPAHGVRVMPSGGEKFEELKRQLRAATDTINIMYFIWEHDVLTRELIDILIERIRAGVEVRMLNDFLGCIPYRKDELKQLKDAGGRVSYDVAALGQLNYRNHRKIVVIDGVSGFTGGCNVGQEYIDGGKKYDSWRDTHVCYTGPAVGALQALFARRWLDVESEDLFTDRFFPAEYPVEGPAIPALTVSTGVDSIWETSRRTHVIGIGEARERAWLQSPYFVPSTDIQIALVNAALSGLDVRLMMTGVPDKKSAWYAANTYIQPLLEAGGRVFHYSTGFLHAKTMTLDGKVTVIGTQNLDIRSLELHKELMVWFFDRELTEQHDRVFLADMEKCRELTLADFENQTWGQRFRDSAFRLASNVL